MGDKQKPQGMSAKEKASINIASQEFLDSSQLNTAFEDTVKRVANYRSEGARARGGSNVLAQSMAKRSDPGAPAGTRAQEALSNATLAGTMAGAVEDKIADQSVSNVQALAGKASGDKTAALQGMGDLSRKAAAEAAERADQQLLQSGRKTNALAAGAGLASGVVYSSKMGPQPQQPAAAGLSSASFSPSTNLAPAGASVEPIGQGMALANSQYRGMAPTFGQKPQPMSAGLALEDPWLKTGGY